MLHPSRKARHQIMNKKVTDEIETGELIQQVDLLRDPAESFKLSRALLSDHAAALAASKSSNTSSVLAAGDQAGAAQLVTQSREKLAGLLRNGFAYYDSLPEEDLSVADRTAARVSYGWEQDALGDLKAPSRIRSLAELAISATPLIVKPAARYPDSLVGRISNWLAVLSGNESIAAGGSRQVLFDKRDTDGANLEALNSQVRHFYSSASKQRDQTPELARINFQPRRDRGDARPQPLPDGAGTATYDEANRTFTLADMPAHATSLRAYRQAAGGQPELAGVSASPTISIVGFTPLTPGVVYSGWVVGKNARGEGAASNHLTFTA